MSWSPNEKKILFTQTNPKSVDLYVIDIATKKAMKINKTPLNVVLRSSIEWADDQSILYHTIVKPATMAPQKSLMPKGPTIQENLGKAAPSAVADRKKLSR